MVDILKFLYKFIIVIIVMASLLIFLYNSYSIIEMVKSFEEGWQDRVGARTWNACFHDVSSCMHEDYEFNAICQYILENAGIVISFTCMFFIKNRIYVVISLIVTYNLIMILLKFFPYVKYMGFY